MPIHVIPHNNICKRNILYCYEAGRCNVKADKGKKPKSRMLRVCMKAF